MVSENSVVLFLPMPDIDTEQAASAVSSALHAWEFGNVATELDGTSLRVTVTCRDQVGADEFFAFAKTVMSKTLDASFESVHFVDDELGQLFYDEGYDEFEGDVSLNGDRADLRIQANGETPDPHWISLARVVVRQWDWWFEKIGQTIAADLIPIYEASWIESDPRAAGQPMDKDSFMGRLSLCSLTFKESTSQLIQFSSDEMFGEHLVVCTIDDEGVIHASLA